jgi:hypothetical protein
VQRDHERLARAELLVEVARRHAGRRAQRLDRRAAEAVGGEELEARLQHPRAPFAAALVDGFAGVAAFRRGHRGQP